MQFEQLQKDMIAAMKARDKVRKDAISALVSAAKKVAIDEGCRFLLYTSPRPRYNTQSRNHSYA